MCISVRAQVIFSNSDDNRRSKVFVNEQLSKWKTKRREENIGNQVDGVFSYSLCVISLLLFLSLFDKCS